MSLHLPTRRTIALAVALGLTSTAAPALPAAAADAPPLRPRNVVLKTTQHPRLIDNPGVEHDVVRFTRVPGTAWKLGEESIEFPDGQSTVDAPVTTAVTATVTDADDSTIDWILPVGTPTAWNFGTPSNEEAPPVNVDAVTAAWNDNPGSRRDTVTLTRVVGVEWVLSGDVSRTYTADDFRGRTTLTVPVTGATQVEAELVPGYELPTGGSLPTVTNPLTADPEVTYTRERLEGLVEVGENPHDSIKGFGPSAGHESVRITGAAGLMWKVGSQRAKAVTGVAYLPVKPTDLDEDGTVEVTAVAGRGYTLPADPVVRVDFSDDAAVPTVTPTDADVRATDPAGTTKDVLTLVAQTGMTWWVGQPGRNGEIAWAATKPAKNGLVTYRVRHATRPADPTEEATVHVKAVANRGYLVDTAKLTETSFTFDRQSTVVPSDNFEQDGTAVTFRPYDGVTSWSVKYPVTIGASTVSRTATVRTADITPTNAESIVIDYRSAPTKVTPKLARDYRLTQ